MIKPIALGEEVWIRRDLQGRGNPFYFREIIVVSWMYFLVAIMIPTELNHLIGQYFLNQAINWSGLFQTIPKSLAINAIFIAIPLSILTSPAWIFCIKRSRLCPISFYAEQLNPERLTVFRLLRAPKVVPLAGSKLEMKKRFRFYTTLKIVDKENADALKISFLTPEEHHRFMAYWNAANPPIPVAQASRLCSSPLSPNG